MRTAHDELDAVARKLRSLKTLADRGMPGEKENARILLERVMKKYGITEQEIDDQAKEYHTISYTSIWERKLAHQIAHMVTGGYEVYTSSVKNDRNVYVLCTKAEFVEIKSNYEFYKRALKKDMEIFYSAFVQRNELFPENGEIKDPDDMPPEERERTLRMLMMSQAMERHKKLKELESGAV